MGDGESDRSGVERRGLEDKSRGEGKGMVGETEPSQSRETGAQSDPGGGGRQPGGGPSARQHPETEQRQDKERNELNPPAERHCPERCRQRRERVAGRSKQAIE